MLFCRRTYHYMTSGQRKSSSLICISRSPFFCRLSRTNEERRSPRHRRYQAYRPQRHSAANASRPAGSNISNKKRKYIYVLWQRHSAYVIARYELELFVNLLLREKNVTILVEIRLCIIWIMSMKIFFVAAWVVDAILLLLKIWKYLFVRSVKKKVEWNLCHLASSDNLTTLPN